MYNLTGTKLGRKHINSGNNMARLYIYLLLCNKHDAAFKGQEIVGAQQGGWSGDQRLVGAKIVMVPHCCTLPAYLHPPLPHRLVYDLFLPTLDPSARGPETLLPNRPIAITTLEDHDHGNNNNNSNNAGPTAA